MITQARRALVVTDTGRAEGHALRQTGTLVTREARWTGLLPGAGGRAAAFHTATSRALVMSRAGVARSGEGGPHAASPTTGEPRGAVLVFATCAGAPAIVAAARAARRVSIARLGEAPPHDDPGLNTDSAAARRGAGLVREAVGGIGPASRETSSRAISRICAAQARALRVAFAWFIERTAPACTRHTPPLAARASAVEALGARSGVAQGTGHTASRTGDGLRALRPEGTRARLAAHRAEVQTAFVDTFVTVVVEAVATFVSAVDALAGGGDGSHDQVPVRPYRLVPRDRALVARRDRGDGSDPPVGPQQRASRVAAANDRSRNDRVSGKRHDFAGRAALVSDLSLRCEPITDRHDGGAGGVVRRRKQNLQRRDVSDRRLEREQRDIRAQQISRPSGRGTLPRPRGGVDAGDRMHTVEIPDARAGSHHEVGRWIRRLGAGLLDAVLRREYDARADQGPRAELGAPDDHRDDRRHARLPLASDDRRPHLGRHLARQRQEEPGEDRALTHSAGR